MKLIQLKYFSRIVECGGFISASRELSVAQPALSRQIAELEAEIGTELLLRGPGGTSVTDAGQRFYRHTRAILDRVKIATEEARRSSGNLAGEVRIAIPVGIASMLAPKIVQTVEQLYSDITVTIEDGLGYQTGQMIDANKVDFGIVCGVGRTQNVILQPLLREDIFLFSRRNDPLPDTMDVALKDVAPLRLVMPNRKVHVRRMLEEAALQIGCKLNVSYEQQSLLTIRGMVRAGVGSTVLNWPSMADICANDELNARRVVDPSLSRIVSLGVSSMRPLTSASRAVHDIVRQIVVHEVSEGNWRGHLILDAERPRAGAEALAWQT